MDNRAVGQSGDGATCDQWQWPEDSLSRAPVRAEMAGAFRQLRHTPVPVA